MDGSSSSGGMAGPGHDKGTSHGWGGKVEEEEKEEVAGAGQYTLFAVVSHCGEMNTGHYVAYIKAQDGCWYQCDDAWVTRVDEAVVAACQAYMLFYLHSSFADA